LCIADLCVGSRALLIHCILAVFVAQSTALVMLGQPAMMAISLVVIAVWCFLKERFAVLGVIAFAISLTLKPQEGALVWLFFLLASRRSVMRVSGTLDTTAEPALKFRRRALQTLVVTLILMTPGILLAFHNPASAHWPRELHTNLVGIAAPGNLCDPGPTNPGVSDIAGLQTIFSLISDTPRFYNAASFAVFVLLFLGWLYLVMRPVGNPDRRLFREGVITATANRDLLAIATAAALSFLSIYHRQYDTRLLLLMFPAIALLASMNRWRGKVALGLGALATVTLSQQFLRLGSRVDHRISNMPAVVRLGFDRPLPLTLLLLSCFFLYCMFRLAFEEREA
jgi:hypothetical protein